MKPSVNYLTFEKLERNYLNRKDCNIRQLILRAIVDHQGEFTGREMSRFIRSLRRKLNGSSSVALSKKQYTALKHFLVSQQRHFGIEYELKEQDPKPSRSEVIPSTASGWAALPLAELLIDNCRTRNLIRTPTIELATRLTYELMALGYGFKPAVWIVTALKVDDLQRPNIAVPSRPGGLTFGFHEFLVNAPVALLLKRLNQITCGQNQAIRFQPTDYAISTRADRASDESEPLVRFVRLQRSIAKCHRVLLKEISGKPVSHHPLRTRKALEETLGTLATLALNLEPAYTYQLRQLPLPNDAVGGISRFIDIAQLNVDYRPLRNEFCTHSLPTRIAVTPTEPEEASTEPVLDFDENWGEKHLWFQTGGMIIETFIAHLNDESFYKAWSKLESEAEQDSLTKFTENHLATLHDSYRYSICAIAVEYMAARLKRNILQVKTAVQTLRAVITHGALRYEDADDLRNWDDDDIAAVMDYLRIGALGNPRAPSTLQAIKSTLINIYIFAQEQHGLLADIPLVKIRKVLLQRYFRNDPWTPGTFEKHYVALGNSNRPDKKREQMMMALAYWGGMRPKEIRHLSLISIETCFDEINLYIRSTKTVNGRRRIPLHLLAPDNILEDCRDYIRTRRKEAEQFTRITTKQIALIGFKDSPHALRREVLTDGITQYLRERGGKHMDLYGLRHSFATLNLLRWQVYTAPETLSLLRVRDHQIFTPTYQQRFAKLFSRHLAGNNEREKVNTLIQIRRLMGHGHLSVTLENYTHCFGALIAIRRTQAQTTTL